MTPPTSGADRPDEALRAYSASNHGSYRSARSTVVTLATSVGVVLVFLHPRVGEVTRVAVADVFWVVAAFSAMQLGATAAHWRWGFASRPYQVLNFAETVAITGGALFLVYRSGRVESIFWVFYFAVLFHAASFAANTQLNLALFVGAPAALALAFLRLRHDPTSAEFTGLVATVSVVGYHVALGATKTTARLTEDRRRLLEQDREMSVHRERERIERDLHDGLGAELTSLVYRVQGMGKAEVERDEVAQRLRDVLRELRSVVWMLRRENRTAGELVAWLRTRCQDLGAGDVRVTFEVDVDEALVVPGEHGMHVVHVVLESVRNALVHARARSVSVSLRLRSAIHLRVRDDGRGLEGVDRTTPTGGLANLRARAASLGGSLWVESGPEGTVVTLTCPLPSGAAPPR